MALNSAPRVADEAATVTERPTETKAVGSGVRTRSVSGVRILPRQDGNRNGFIRDYEILASADGKDWGAPVATGAFDRTAVAKTVTFDRPVTARAIRLVAKNGFDGQPFASVAELDLVTE